MAQSGLKFAFFLCVWMVLAEAFTPTGLMTIRGRSSRELSRAIVIPFLSDIPFDQDSDISSFDQDFSSNIDLGAAPPKTSLEIVNQSHTAKPWILNLIACSHWASLFPSFAASYAIFSHSSTWYDLFDHDSLRVMLWMLAPLIMFASALPPIAMHVYEDWQIAPAQDPSQESFRFQDFNNDRLRGVSITMLFNIIAASNFATIFGYFGADVIIPCLFLAVATSTMKDPTNAILPKSFPNRDLISPSQLGSTILMAISTAVSCGVYFDMAGQTASNGNPLLYAATISALPLISLGGMYEGFVGDTTFNQWDHELASMAIFSGCTAWAWALFEIGQNGLII